MAFCCWLKKKKKKTRRESITMPSTAAYSYMYLLRLHPVLLFSVLEISVSIMYWLLRATHFEYCDFDHTCLWSMYIYIFCGAFQVVSQKCVAQSTDCDVNGFALTTSVMIKHTQLIFTIHVICLESFIGNMCTDRINLHNCFVAVFFLSPLFICQGTNVPDYFCMTLIFFFFFNVIPPCLHSHFWQTWKMWVYVMTSVSLYGFLGHSKCDKCQTLHDGNTSSDAIMLHVATKWFVWLRCPVLPLNVCRLTFSCLTFESTGERPISHDRGYLFFTIK